MKKALRPSTSGTRTPRKSKPRAPKGGPTVRVTRGNVEQQALYTVIQSPARKLPRALINSKTGLARNGLQAHCRRETRSSFWCVVRPARHKPGEGLYARYRVNRKGTSGAFTWFRYRNG
jgi:hypothetical protein